VEKQRNFPQGALNNDLCLHLQGFSVTLNLDYLCFSLHPNNDFVSTLFTNEFTVFLVLEILSAERSKFNSTGGNYQILLLKKKLFARSPRATGFE
jgi:hypothetical protein